MEKRIHPYRPFHQSSDPAIQEFQKGMLEARAIEEASFLAFQARLFSVPKKDTEKRRVILNISSLNTSIFCPKFKMTSVSQVR